MMTVVIVMIVIMTMIKIGLLHIYAMENVFEKNEKYSSEFNN